MLNILKLQFVDGDIKYVKGGLQKQYRKYNREKLCCMNCKNETKIKTGFTGKKYCNECHEIIRG